MRRHLLATAILFAVHSAQAADEPTPPPPPGPAPPPPPIATPGTLPKPHPPNTTLGGRVVKLCRGA